MTRDGNSRKRVRLAQCVERATVPERPFTRFGPRYLVHPNIAAACTPSLLTIAAALRDDTRPVADANLEAVHRFVSDGSSAFFGYNATTALWESIRLEHAVVGAETIVRDEEEVAVGV